MTMIIDGTNGLTFNNATTQASAGKVLQVVSTTITSQLSFTGAAQDITGLSATITPKFNTSKILVNINLAFTNGSNGDAYFTVLRGSTVIPTGVSGSLINGSSSGAFGNSMLSVASTYLDSPATTSATTYKMQAATSGITLYVNRRAIDTNYTGQSTITLMEIAA